MSSYIPASTLTLKQLLFPLALVLFEFAAYIAHDMIQPAMLLVTAEFDVSAEWVSASLTAYLVGGIALQWLLGPLSDKYGRRPVMQSGVLFFLLVCLLTPWAENMVQFIMLRFLQGSSLCFIGAVGYAAIQEAFDESLSIKIMAQMANVALLAPLAGPLAGAAFLSFSGWRNMFWIFAALAALAAVGLWHAMPETSGNRQISISLKTLGKGYWRLTQNCMLVTGSLAIGLVFVPLLAWVALSPVIFIQDEGLTRMHYALLQLPVFLAMIAGNTVLSKLTGRRPIEQPLRLGAWPILLGLLVATVATQISTHCYLWLTAGLSIYGFGAGMVNAGLYRLTLLSDSAGKGSIAAMLGMISIITFALGIELVRYGYFSGGSQIFSLINLCCGVLWLIMLKLFLRERKQRSTVSAI